MSVEILDAHVNWRGTYENTPDLTLLVRGREAPSEHRYEKHPCGREQLSTEQAAVVGSRMEHEASGWHVYVAEDDGFVSFFTWGGEPDDGFGGRRRTITLTDGTEEEIVGGWHVGPTVLSEVGFGNVWDCAVQDADGDLMKRNERSAHSRPWWKVTPLALAVRAERLVWAVNEYLPDVVIKDGQLAWRGQPTKTEWHRTEKERIQKAIMELEQQTGRIWARSWRPHPGPITRDDPKRRDLDTENELFREFGAKDDPEFKYHLRPYETLGPT